MPDYVAWVSEDEPSFEDDVEKVKFQTHVEKLLTLPLMEIITKFDASVKGDIIVNDLDYYGCRIAIRYILRVPTSHKINECMSEIQDSFEAQDAKLRNHRHDTTKSFSAKPEF